MQVLKSIIPIIIIVQNFFTFANPEDSSNQLSNIQDKYFTQCTEEMSDKDNLLVDW